MNCTNDSAKIQPKDVEHQVGNQTWSSKLWNAIEKAFLSRPEPIFWEKCDRDGNTYLQGYDPNSGRSIYLASEDEARIWLDQSSMFRY